MFWTQLKPLTKACLVCNKDIYENNTLSSFFYHSEVLCLNCYKRLMILNEKSIFNNHEILTLYGYDDFIRDLIFRYKTMNDEKLNAIFLEPFIKQINKEFKDYTLIFPPSSKKALEQRGFSHMELICKTTSLKYLSFFYKTDDHKQSLVKSSQRKINAEKINYYSNIDLPNKILLIDDILTTGSTIKACLSILHELNIKDIKILIIAKSLKVIS